MCFGDETGDTFVSRFFNLTMFNNPALPSYGFPLLGGVLMALMILRPQWFKGLSVVFTGYTVLILLLTA